MNSGIICGQYAIIDEYYIDNLDISKLCKYKNCSNSGIQITYVHRHLN